MRDRLIELIDESTGDVCGGFYGDEVVESEIDITEREIERIADYLIANGATVQEWISVKDRLPETDDWVLVCRKTIKTGYTTMVVDRCTFTVGGDRMWLAEYATYKQVVTHWMPLPQPPKGE